jgi:hypothetical protein
MRDSYFGVKKLLIVFVLILFVIPLISCVEVDIKDSFNMGETLIAKVSGNFYEPVLNENVFFYRGHIRIPVIHGVVNVNDEFYIYALLPENASPDSNYSMVIKNARYMQGTKIVEDDIVRNFSINNETADFFVNPGAVFSSKEFSLKVQNLKDVKINVDVNVKEGNETSGKSFWDLFDTEEKTYESEFSLKSGEIKDLKFNLSELNESSVRFIELSSENTVYEVPVYWIVSGSSVSGAGILRFEPSYEEGNFSINNPSKRIFYLFNDGKKSVFNVTLNVSSELRDYANLSIDYIDEIKAGSNAKIELDFFYDKEGVLNAEILADGNNQTHAEADVSFTFIEGYIPLEENESGKNVSNKNCLDLGGIICEENQECDQQVIYAKDGVCCPGYCNEVQTSSTMGKVIGWIIIVVIIGFLVWFLMTKYKGASKKIDLFKIAKGKR